MNNKNKLTLGAILLGSMYFLNPFSTPVRAQELHMNGEYSGEKVTIQQPQVPKTQQSVDNVIERTEAIKEYNRMNDLFQSHVFGDGYTKENPAWGSIYERLHTAVKRKRKQDDLDYKVDGNTSQNDLNFLVDHMDDDISNFNLDKIKNRTRMFKLAYVVRDKTEFNKELNKYRKAVNFFKLNLYGNGCEEFPGFGSIAERYLRLRSEGNLLRYGIVLNNHEFRFLIDHKDDNANHLGIREIQKRTDLYEEANVIKHKNKSERNKERIKNGLKEAGDKVKKIAPVYKDLKKAKEITGGL